MRNRQVCLILGFLTISPFTFSQSPEKKTDPVAQTVELLKNPKALESLFEQDAKAKKTDSHLDELTGGDTKLKKQMYELSAQIFEDLVKKHGENPEKLQKLLEEAARNPQAFFEKHMSPADREAVRKLSSQLPQKVTQP